jgi:hypothetical protein
VTEHRVTRHAGLRQSEENDGCGSNTGFLVGHQEFTNKLRPTQPLIICVLGSKHRCAVCFLLGNLFGKFDQFAPIFLEIRP